MHSIWPALGLLLAGRASAQTANDAEPPAAHDHHAMLGAHDHAAAGTRGALSLGVLAASYRSPLYDGTYQGIITGARLSRGRIAVAASLTAYRLDRNGLTVDGVGDATLHAHVTVVARGALAAGAMVMTSLPTGDDARGLGMGRPMIMPEAWLAWTAPRVALTASAGYARMLGGAAAHARHGAPMWPLVDPMNAEELPFEGLAMASLTGAIAAGARIAGAVPLGAGTTRLAAGGRLAWTHGRVTTTAELAAGVAGDPFELRGVVEAAVQLP